MTSEPESQVVVSSQELIVYLRARIFVALRQRAIFSDPAGEALVAFWTVREKLRILLEMWEFVTGERWGGEDAGHEGFGSCGDGVGDRGADSGERDVGEDVQ
jgi:hypothetical protein